MSNRLYIGNLDKKVTEEDIRQLFQDRELPLDSVLLKSGYAFVDCHDQATVDAAIDKLADMQLYDKPMHVEPAVSKNRNGSRIVFKNLPEGISDEELRKFLSESGFEELKDISKQSGEFQVTFISPEQAADAREKLNEKEFQGLNIKVEFPSRKMKPPTQNMQRQEFPLRLLVPHQFVGAIIGKAGQTIKNITQQTNARVDVVRRDNTVAGEKMVMILGSQTDNCIQACREILQVINKEADQTGQPKREPELRILAHNNLCGRLIGKQGTIIKAVMSETNTTVTVSSLGSLNLMNQDRVVTIKGAISDILTAAEKIYNKLKACNEADLQSLKFSPQQMYPPPMMVPNPMWQARGPYMPMAAPYPVPHLPTTAAAAAAVPQASNIGGHMTCYLYIPKASVGAVIGSKGSYINYVKQESRASCQVQERNDDPEANERPVKITGYPECVWKAQWYIFDKVKAEGFTGNEYARLRCDVMIPKNMVGRVIGKGGRNVRHIQEISDAVIKLPDEQNTESEEVPVQVVGNIYSQTLAQALVRQLLEQGQIVPYYGEAGPGPMYGAAAAAAGMARLPVPPRTLVHPINPRGLPQQQHHLHNQHHLHHNQPRHQAAAVSKSNESAGGNTNSGEAADSDKPE